LALLQTETGEAARGDVIEANRLRFAAVRQELKESSPTPLDHLHEALESDYRILTYLLEQAAHLETGSIEQRILDLDYRLMRIWYKLTRNSSAPHARRALTEMSNILNYFAGTMGQRLAAQSSRG
jgi:hypothetical protein